MTMPKAEKSKDGVKHQRKTPKKQKPHRGKWQKRKNGGVDLPRKSSSSKKDSKEPTKSIDATKSEAKKSEEMQRVATSAADGQSFAVLLTQGILSGDEEKIESVIKNSDKATIIATVKKLPVVHLIPFLNHMEKRFREGKKEQMEIYLTWIRAVLSVHMSYLSSVRKLDHRLGTLGEWMSKRVNHLDRLMALQGKLQLIVDQMQHRSKPNLMAQQEPIILFQDEDRLASDLDDFEFEQESDHSEAWWEDKELGDVDEDMEESDEPGTSRKRSKQLGKRKLREGEDKDEEMEVDDEEDSGEDEESEEESEEDEKIPSNPSKKLNGPHSAHMMNGRKGVDEDDDEFDEDEEGSSEDSDSD
uniref:Small-subunit processome Utp12 domain-containing protein n=1 Tax=Acrobeloides nanus TaxID=290746 RepID=A0A914C414_9BILA